MYYQEKWIDGKLYVKTLPNTDWKIKPLTLADLQKGVEEGHISIITALKLAYELVQKSETQLP